MPNALSASSVIRSPPVLAAFKWHISRDYITYVLKEPEGETRPRKHALTSLRWATPTNPATGQNFPRLIGSSGPQLRDTDTARITSGLILLHNPIKLSEEEEIAAEVQTDRKILVDQSILCNVVTITEDYSESTGETYSAPKEILSKEKDVNESRSFLYKMFWCCSNCYKNTDEEIAVPIAVKTVEE
ncbi:Hypothetical predicted protein [Pelobates cultripes]|uniref:Uncharacterized protein n=1 Tax=Pelobates cultripes TaxID=61616 RepID=A0AAD1VKH0_PELCU|nr:Hypothetical predicted protein [Pelobates cultripes]